MSLDTVSMSNEDCVRRYFATEYPRISIASGLCTANKKGQGSCQGDSGSGLVHVEQQCLAGVSSWGVPCARDMPDIYARISVYRHWIRQQIEATDDQDH